jgi:hypothetical protein
MRQVIATTVGEFMPLTPERRRSIHTTDGGIILDINRGKIFSLNASASVMFQLLERGLTEEDIADELVRRFGIPAQQALVDLIDFRKSLDHFSLLSSGGSASKE